MSNNILLVEKYLKNLQNNLCSALEFEEKSQQKFIIDEWKKNNIAGRTCILAAKTFEKAGVNFSRIKSNALPKAATDKRPDLIGAEFEALGVSSVIHPDNPFVPTSHMNVRYFQATKPDGDIVWWFGGGFDLTPYYGFDEDCLYFHKTAKKACDQVNLNFYPEFKKNADDYFYIKHRDEQRGIGGIFFDDFNQPDFETCFALLKNVGDGFIEAYIPIVQKRKFCDFTQQQKDFQAYRCGRYVEFNLVYDRGTLFGLQVGGRIESILMSLPPKVEWIYNFTPEKNSPEEKLTEYYLKPREWV